MWFSKHFVLEAICSLVEMETVKYSDIIQRNSDIHSFDVWYVLFSTILIFSVFLLMEAFHWYWCMEELGSRYMSFCWWPFMTFILSVWLFLLGIVLLSVQWHSGTLCTLLGIAVYWVECGWSLFILFILFRYSHCSVMTFLFLIVLMLYLLPCWWFSLQIATEEWLLEVSCYIMSLPRVYWFPATCCRLTWTLHLFIVKCGITTFYGAVVMILETDCGILWPTFIADILLLMMIRCCAFILLFRCCSAGDVRCI